MPQLTACCAGCIRWWQTPKKEAHAECAAGITHVPWANKALSSHECTDLYTNPALQLHSWSQGWTSCVATGDAEPSSTTVAEDLESLDKDALILKLKQVGVALY
jgi:hypothetical protein